MTISLTEENYIKAIFNLSNSNNIGVSTNSLSNHLKNKALARSFGDLILSNF